ncbi:ankyrin repeat domain-containing protein [Endozoicomonas acroporae]|nr:ankyrin repeat domain-containing protein [Endozoicomonas acroporae]
MIDSAGHLYSIKITIDGDFKMQVTITDPQPLKYDTPSGADSNKHNKGDPRFADSSVATTNIPPQIAIQSYAPTFPTTPITGVSCKVINPDDTASITGRNASELLKSPFNSDPGYESTLCKWMKSESDTSSADRAKQDSVIKTLLMAITDTDTSNATRLISECGATELSGYRCSFSFEGTTYPDITPFALACSLGKLDLVKKLYANPEQLNQTFDTTDGTGQKPVNLAAMNGHVEVMSQLFKWGVDPQSIVNDALTNKILSCSDSREAIKKVVTELCLTGELELSEKSVLCIGSRDECKDGDDIGCLGHGVVYVNPDYNQRQQVVEGSYNGRLLARLFSE